MEQKQSSDSSDSECEVVKRVKSSNDEMDVLMPNACSTKIESEIQKKKEKYNIWSDILLERQLTESLSKSVHLSANGFSRKPWRNRCENKAKMDATKMGNEHAEQKIMTVRVFQPKGDKPENICSANEHNRKRKFTRNNRPAVGQDVESVVQMIITQLKEPKVYLIRKVVTVIGCHAAIKLCAETLDVESAGGLMIANGNRRRTPGGVFLTLLRANKKITQQQKDEIFADDKQTKQKKKKSKRRIRNSGKTIVCTIF
ncbi:phosphorylated adapter RNA export protein-like protein [Leptotrombidium deliense]|uniref:Phosphorylated adapter RNA export protein n=1 Tax=Leptotrombidium deliense TaxID=299467 RepID=A0A443SVP1_9ACAR|nr:phosphorylated adapter RNA export protein-like protein [Leptotrombidium deliense]